MITEKDLIAGKTILKRKSDFGSFLYLGNFGIVHCLSVLEQFERAGSVYTLHEINKRFTLAPEEDKTVPLEKKVYDFVPVMISDNGMDWEKKELIVVLPNKPYPYRIFNEEGGPYCYKYAKFI